MPPAPDPLFAHEKLDVYQKSLEFITWLSPILEATTRIGEVKDQLDRASTSITFNLAEGNGKFTANDRCRFFDIAHGSALECAAGLDILVAKGKQPAERVRQGKEQLRDVVRMLMGLIKANSARDYKKAQP